MVPVERVSAARALVRRVPGAVPVKRRIRRAAFARDLRLLHDVPAGTAFAGRYFVCGGLLLGWARDGELLLDDLYDADFAYDVDDAREFASALPALLRAGFRRIDGS